LVNTCVEVISAVSDKIIVITPTVCGLK